MLPLFMQQQQKQCLHLISGRTIEHRLLFGALFCMLYAEVEHTIHWHTIIVWTSKQQMYTKTTDAAEGQMSRDCRLNEKEKNMYTFRHENLPVS